MVKKMEMCKHCGKEIVGWTDNHIDYMMSAHIKAKHKLIKDERFFDKKDNGKF